MKKLFNSLTGPSMKSYTREELKQIRIFNKFKKDKKEHLKGLRRVIVGNLRDLEEGNHELPQDAIELFKEELYRLLEVADNDELLRRDFLGEINTMPRKEEEINNFIDNLESDLQSVIANITTYEAANIEKQDTAISKGGGIAKSPFEEILKEVKDLKQILVNHINSPFERGTKNRPQAELLSGGGIVSSTTNFIKSVGRKSKEIVGKVISGNTGLPPAVKKILDKHGSQLIKEITIVRNPVGSALVSALSVASMGEFKKNLKASPYDKLFHLKLVITLQNGMKVSLEKVERVSMTINPKKVKGEEELHMAIQKQLTLDQLYHNGEMKMGDKFYPYSARDNNCQDFVMAILEGSGLASAREKEFVKQNTTDLFGDDDFVRKLSNTLTDVGARFNVLLQGGAIKGIFRKKKGKGVFPPMYEEPDFIQLPTYLQNEALAKGTAHTGDDSSDTDVEDGMGIDFDEIEWGSFKKAFYNRQKKYKHLKTLETYAKYIMEHPDDFNKHTKKRANFYLNVLKK